MMDGFVLFFQYCLYLLQVVERIRSGTGPKKMLVIDMDTEREMALKVSTPWH